MKTMRNTGLILLLILLCGSMTGYAQSSKYQKKLKKHRKKIEREFKSPRHSPIKDIKARMAFPGNDYYPIDESYKVTARIERTPNAAPFEMNTSSGKTKTFVKWAVLHFELKGQKCELSIYQNLKLMEQPQYKKYLFLPFKDHTNGEETYGGGRYIEVNQPDSPTEMEIDFNKCFNPYCAYSDGWNCPIVPIENYLEMKVEAGVKGWLEH